MYEMSFTLAIQQAQTPQREGRTIRPRCGCEVAGSRTLAQAYLHIFWFAKSKVFAQSGCFANSKSHFL
jgi:hypothetical protein